MACGWRGGAGRGGSAPIGDGRLAHRGEDGVVGGGVGEDLAAVDGAARIHGVHDLPAGVAHAVHNLRGGLGRARLCGWELWLVSPRVCRAFAV